MKNYITKSTKSPSVQKIIDEALDILKSVGVSFEGRTERALQSMAMSFLSVTGVVGSWTEAKDIEEGRLLTTREIIKFINKHFEENKSLGSYDDIRRRDLQPLILDNLVINTSKHPNASINDPTRGYTVNKDFKNLVKSYNTAEWSKNLKIFKEKKESSIVDISVIHDLVFDFLSEWSDNTSNALNPFFIVRTREDEKFEMGYWFPGNEEYLAVSFWSGGDAINQTPNVYIEINPKKHIVAHIVAQDSENKRKYFERLLVHLNNYKREKQKGRWTRTLSEKFDNDFLKVIGDYIKLDKLVIDEFLSSTLKNFESADHKLLEEDFSSKFDFIDEKQFYKLKSRVQSRKFKIQNKETESFIVGDELPIAILSLSVENFQGIKKAVLSEDLPTNSKWIFLTGENGFGKTSVLQAIALGLTNYDDNREYFKGNEKININYIKKGERISNQSLILFTSNFKDLNSNLLAYGPIRLNTQASSSENQENKNSGNIYNLLHKDGLLKNISYLIKLSKLQTKSSKEFDNLKNALMKIVDYRIKDIKINEFGDIVYSESDNYGSILGENSLEQLATGFQSLINLVGDIITRFSKEFPDDEYCDYEGIIIIDELENHLHPVLQKKLPGLLSGIFPKVQFIVSVHSPIPLLGAPKNSVILKVNRDAERSITIERIIIDNIESLNPNILFTSPVFGFTSIISDNLVDLKKLRTEDSWDEMKNREQLDNELLSLYNSTKKN